MLHRAERIARGEEEDFSGKSRLSMAQAALLNMRGPQALQGQLQDEGRLGMPKVCLNGAAESSQSQQLPIHPLNISQTAANTNTVSSAAYEPNALPKLNFGVNELFPQVGNAFKGG